MSDIVLRPLRGAAAILVLAAACAGTLLAADGYDPLAEAAKALSTMDVRPDDSPQLGKSHYRNNVSDAKNIPTEWDVATGKNIKWSAKLGSQTYSSPVVANGKLFVGTNNANGYLKRYPSKVDLGCLLAFDA